MQKQITSIYGYQQITDLSASIGLTVPTTDIGGLVGSPVTAYIRCETQSVRWRDDGVAPSATVGFPLSPGDMLAYDGDLKRIKFIEQAASAKLNVVYYT
jgi:hypothetical protein